MFKLASLFRLSLVLVVLIGVPALALAQTGGSSGTVGGGSNSDAVAGTVGGGWNDTSGLSCSVSGNTLTVSTAGPAAAACDIDFNVLLKDGVTLSDFDYELSVTVNAGKCVAVTWRTGRPGQGGQFPGTAVPEGASGNWNVPIGFTDSGASAVPALGEWGMIIVGIGVVTAAVMLIRRRTRADGMA